VHKTIKPKPRFAFMIILVIVTIVLSIITFLFIQAIIPLLFLVIMIIASIIMFTKTSWTIEKDNLILKSLFNNLKVPLNQIESVDETNRPFLGFAYNIKIKESYIKNHLPNISSFNNSEMTIANTDPDETKKFIKMIKKGMKKSNPKKDYSSEKHQEYEEAIEYTKRDIRKKFPINIKITITLIVLLIISGILFFAYPNKITLLFMGILMAISSIITFKRELKIWKFVKENNIRVSYSKSQSEGGLKVRGKMLSVHNTVEFIKNITILLATLFLFLVIVIWYFVK
jgi:hypothetical protein